MFVKEECLLTYAHASNRACLTVKALSVLETVGLLTESGDTVFENCVGGFTIRVVIAANCYRKGFYLNGYSTLFYLSGVLSCYTDDNKRR